MNSKEQNSEKCTLLNKGVNSRRKSSIFNKGGNFRKASILHIGDNIRKLSMLYKEDNRRHLRRLTLLYKGDDFSTTVVKSRLLHALILPAMFAATVGLQFFTRILTGWTQSNIKAEYFPNISHDHANMCTMNKSSSVYRDAETVQRHAAQWSLMYTLGEFVPALIVQSFLPSYTDVYGRKVLLILSSIGIFIRGITVCFTVYYQASFWFIVAANIIQGLSGSVSSLYSAIYAFVADVTYTQNQRTAGIVAIQALILFASVSVSYLSGYFIETIKLGFYHTSVIGASACGVAVLLFVALPESLPMTRRSKPKSVVKTMKRIVDFYVGSDRDGQRIGYILLLLAFLFASLSSVYRAPMETLYFLGEPFCWGPSKIGLFSMARYGAQGLIGIGTVRLLQVCLSNATMAIVSTVSSILSYIIEAFAQNSLTIYMVPVSGILSFLMIPMIRSMMSSMTSPDKQGAMFAGMAIIEVMGTLIASLSDNEIYASTLSFMNGFVFLMMGFCSMVAMVLLIVYKCVKSSEILPVEVYYIQENDLYPSGNRVNMS